jgi:hypothetical protein
MPDELSGSVRQDQNERDESHMLEPTNASPSSGNGCSHSEGLPLQDASHKALPDADQSPSLENSIGEQQAKSEAVDQPLSKLNEDGNGVPDPTVQPPDARTPDSADAPVAQIEKEELDEEESIRQEAIGEDDEEYVPRDLWIPEESLRDRTPMVELIRVHYPTWTNANLCLVEWEENQPKITRVDHGIRVDGYYRSTPNFPDALKKSLLLPTGLTPYISTKELFGTVQDRLRNWVRLSETQAALLTYWCFSTWFPEYLRFVPRLTITGPKLAADSLMQALHSVCCKPIPLAGINSAVLRTIPFNDFIPTLLMLPSRLSRAAMEFLDASDGKGYFVANGKDLQRSLSVKCIYPGEEYKKKMSTSAGIHIHLAKNAFMPAAYIPSSEEVQKLQNQLFLYRVYNRSMVRNSAFRVDNLLPELCAVAQQLGAVVADESSLQRDVIELFESQNEQSRTDDAFALNGVVLRAVLHFCHQPDRQKVFVREVAETVNAMYKELGEPMKFSNESVGLALKTIGFYTRRLGSAGRGLTLDNATRREAHELSRANEIIPDSSEPKACSYCQNLDPSAEELM